MALINCPNCNNQISNKAKKCPYCGFNSNESALTVNSHVATVLCQECGAEVSQDEESCPKCGYPIHELNDNNADVVESNPIYNSEDTSDIDPIDLMPVKPRSRKKLICIVSCIAIICIIGSIIGVVKYNKSKADNYGSTVKLVTYSILSSASEAENAGNLIHDVWYNTIYEKNDSKTNKYTKGKYSFNKDFNESLSNLFLDSSFSEKISNIKKDKQSIESLMKSLNSPPKEYAEAYDALKDLYTNYTKLVDLTTNPKGSLQSFTSDFNEYDRNVLSSYNNMSLYITE